MELFWFHPSSFRILPLIPSVIFHICIGSKDWTYIKGLSVFHEWLLPLANIATATYIKWRKLCNSKYPKRQPGAFQATSFYDSISGSATRGIESLPGLLGPPGDSRSLERTPTNGLMNNHQYESLNRGQAAMIRRLSVRVKRRRRWSYYPPSVPIPALVLPIQKISWNI